MPEAFILSSDHRTIDINAQEIQESDLISSLADQVFETALRKSGIQVDEIDSLIWGGELPKHPAHLPAIQVTHMGLSGLQALLFANQAIQAGNLQIAAAGGVGKYRPDQAYFERIIQQLLGTEFLFAEDLANSHKTVLAAAGSAAMVLASTGMVGSSNLVPVARLAGLAQSPLEMKDIHQTVDRVLKKAMMEAEITLEEVSIFDIDPIWSGVIPGWLASIGIEAGRINSGKDQQTILHTGDAEGVIRVCQLISALKQSKQQYSLLLQVGLDFSLMAIVVERIL